MTELSSGGARVEPNWIQVKVGACSRHLWGLEILNEQWYIGADPIERLRQRVAGRDQLEDEGHLAPRGCEVETYSSRVCELGTRSCVKHHEERND